METRDQRELIKLSAAREGLPEALDRAIEWALRAEQHAVQTYGDTSNVNIDRTRSFVRQEQAMRMAAMWTGIARELSAIEPKGE